MNETKILDVPCPTMGRGKTRDVRTMRTALRRAVEAMQEGIDKAESHRVPLAQRDGLERTRYGLDRFHAGEKRGFLNALYLLEREGLIRSEQVVIYKVLPS